MQIDKLGKIKLKYREFWHVEKLGKLSKPSSFACWKVRHLRVTARQIGILYIKLATLSNMQDFMLSMWEVKHTDN